MEKTLSEIAVTLEKKLRDRGQSENVISQYHYLFKVFVDYCAERGEVYMNESLLTACLKDHYGIDNSDTVLSRSQHYKKGAIRALRLMRDEALGLPLANRYLKEKKRIHTPIYINAVKAFQKQLYENSYSPKTINTYSRTATQFFEFLESQKIYSPEEICPENIHGYTLSLSKYSKVSVKHSLGAVRIFLGFLYLEGYISKDFRWEIKIPRMVGQRKIPSVWGRDEVLRLLSVIDRGNPSGKRDYAMILLSARLGIRISDICSLKFSNLDWRNERLIFTQSKTKQDIALPLLRDVGWSLIDYIQNGRPKVELPYIFITHIVPYKEFSSDNHHHRMIEKYMQWAHIPIVPKKKTGMHSLRHTLATVMLENHEDYQNITAALGHRSTDSTSVYLKTSIDLLRDCALPMPEVSK